jgi:hypothetical protein
LWVPGGRGNPLEKYERALLAMWGGPFGIEDVTIARSVMTDVFEFRIEFESGVTVTKVVTGHSLAQAATEDLARHMIEQVIREAKREEEQLLREREEEAARSWDERPPDYMDYVIGFRAWQIVGRPGLWQLGSVGIGDETEWNGREEVKAICRSDSRFFTDPDDEDEWTDSHPIPSPNCTCGFYAWHNPEDVSLHTDVWGAVIARGRLEVHREGFRAEYMQPLAFAIPEDSRIILKRNRAVHAVIRNNTLPAPGGVEFYEESVDGAVEGLSRWFDIPAVPESGLVDYARRYGGIIPVDERP